MKHNLLSTLLTIVFIALTSCSEEINDDRIPPAAVNLELSNQGMWDTYGVHGYGQYRKFIKSEKIPSNFPYSATSYTGFGGILLICGYYNGDYNAPLAYDLACPVEAKQTTRVNIDSNTFEAVCPVCGSHYDVCEGEGRPVSGKAAELNYGMQRYHVYSSTTGGYIIVY